jgi:hypothetical protein
MSRKLRKLAKALKRLRQLAEYTEREVEWLEAAAIRTPLSDEECRELENGPEAPGVVDCTRPATGGMVNEEWVALRALRDAVVSIGQPETWRNVELHLQSQMYVTGNQGARVADCLDAIEKAEAKL